MNAVPRLVTVASIALFLCNAATAAQWSAAENEQLRAMAVGERIALGLPQRASPTLFERIEVYAPDARIWVIDEHGKRQIPRSTARHYVAISGKPAAFTVDMESGALSGLQMVDSQPHLLEGSVRSDGAIAVQLGARTDRNQQGEAVDWACGGGLEHDHELPSALQLASAARAAPPGTAKGAPATRQARIAVDTDTEIMSLKFSNSTSQANNYIASLFALMNGIFEAAPGAGGLDLRVVIGDVFLRVGSDPYSAVDGNAQLNEFSEFWRVSQGAVQRAFAMLLSGKSSNPNSASGIAWVLTSGNYCSSTGQVFPGGTFGHYSATKVFRFPGSTAANDVSVIAHEVGHNLGAFHTHCTATNGTGPTGTGTMDQCFSGESVGPTACYSGSVSCPGGNAGTLMSYCHFSAGSGGPNCGPAMTLFHPGHVTNLTGRIATNFPGCITPLAAMDPIFANGFE